MRYEPMVNLPGEPVDEDNPEAEDDVDPEEANELDPLVPNGSAQGSYRYPTPKTFSGHFSNTTHSHGKHLAASRNIPKFTPATLASNDGVFANIPAKPTSSRDRVAEDEALEEDEWIFMTPKQRLKLAPPKYSKIKRDRAPLYTTEYTPPVTLVSADTGTLKRSRRSPAVRPRINTLPAGSSKLFVTSAVICTLLPLLGYTIVYLVNGRHWRSHATRLGSRLGLGLGLFHVGAMMFYIPAFLPSVPITSSVPLLLFLLWTGFVGLPFGWRLSRHAAREYLWLKAEERVLLERIVQTNLIVAADDEVEVEGRGEEDMESGRRYIQGTDIRVRDLKKIIARARDARLARSLRAAGF